jgi:predicted alpha/beta hydrolase
MVMMMHAAKRIAAGGFIRALSTSSKNSQVVFGKELQITCADQVQLAATVFTPPQNQPLKSAILVAPATGVKRRFYSKFAAWLSTNGYAVITFNNRGIGDSLHGRLRDCKASIVDWGALDMPAVLSELHRQFPEANSYHIVGHSAGGQVVGLMHNVTDEVGDTTITSMFNVSCSSGSVKNMQFLFGLQASWFLNMFIPISNQIFGYSNTQWLGMGGPLPYNVGRQWREWCNAEGYVKTAFGREVEQHWYDQLSCPSIWIHSTDDGIANVANVKDMLSVHSKSFQDKAKIVALVPADYELKEIGHMKFFSHESKVLWEIALEWFDSFEEKESGATKIESQTK